MRGKLIVFEGVDGVGKSTLAADLVEHLNQTMPPAQLLSFPGRKPGTLGAHVYALHHNGVSVGVRSINPTSLQVLHVAAHIDAIHSTICPLLNSGITVVLDRFWWSTWVYGMTSGVKSESLEDMIRLELHNWGETRPDRLILVDRATPLQGELDSELWQRRRQGYKELAAKESGKYAVVVIQNEADMASAIHQVRVAIDHTWKDASNTHWGTSCPSSHQLRLPITDETPPRFSKDSLPVIFSRLEPAKTSEVYDTYWRFATERQEVFFRRLEGQPPPWSQDQIIRHHKFTNAYRASDRVSQYLIRNVIYQGDQTPEEIFFRTILFKIFNRIQTWELFVNALGHITWAEFDETTYDTILSRAMSSGHRIYSAAYIMPSGGRHGEERKHRTHLRVLQMMMNGELPKRLSEASSMRKAFEMLRSYPTIGDFLAYQYVTDINYSVLTDFSESDFVIPGPGAKDGIRKCFPSTGGLNESDVIRLVTDRQEVEFQRVGVSFRTLWGRPLQLIDCQNLFCEVDKYARIAHPEVKGISSRTRIKQIFRANDSPVTYWYPPKWGFNHRIDQRRTH